MQINMTRFMQEMKTINCIGYKENQGITRLALTDEDMQAREFIKNTCKNLKLKVWEDAIGNIWARKEGKKHGLPSVLMGSHLDTVPNGGKYDGVLGVMSAIEVLRMIQEQQVEHNHPIEIIVFSVEESSRFNVSTVGSKAVTGGITSSKLKTYIDKDGISLYDALMQRGFSPDNLESTRISTKNVKAFLELHIEQGPILENENINIGIVEAIAAPIRLQIQFVGEEAHSGSCPMKMRKDALTAAAEVILEVEEKAIEESEYKTVATTGKCEVFPGAMNVIPGKVELFIDIRGINLESILRTLNEVINKTEKICNRRRIDYQISVLSQEKPVFLDKEMMHIVRENCEKLGLTYKKMASGAGHDTMNIAKVIPSSLIFIPCIKGISHNKNEDVKMKDLENGIKILFETIVTLAK